MGRVRKGARGGVIEEGSVSGIRIDARQRKVIEIVFVCAAAANILIGGKE